MRAVQRLYEQNEDAQTTHISIQQQRFLNTHPFKP